MNLTVPLDAEILSVQGLTVCSPEATLVPPLDLALRSGEPLTLLGETGAGKSLVAQAILGALPTGLSAEGEIRLSGERIDQLGPRAHRTLWGRRIALLPQEPWTALDPTMKVGPQVADAARLVAGRRAAEAGDEVHTALEQVGLADAAGCYPHQLSGGMAQRVAFAAATISGAEIVIADEPTKGLDAEMRDRVAALLAQVTQRGGSLLTITHDVALARALGGRLAILRAGRIVETGAAADVLAAPSSEYGRALVAAEPRNWPRARPPELGLLQLRCRDLTLARGRRTILSGFDLDLHAGERIALTGSSGSGKTTLLDALAGLLSPAAGTVSRMADMPEFAVQKLYQDPPSAFPAARPLVRTLRDLERLHRLTANRIRDLLDRLGIAPALLERLPGEVSGGELQRISLARALALRPAVLLADEPTSRLDLVTQRTLMDFLSEMTECEQLAVILVTHDPDIASQWAHRIVDLSAMAGARR